MNPRIPALLALVAGCLLPPTPAAAQTTAVAPAGASQLTEPNERRANQIQPPNEVMDLLGIRPGLVIGEVGAGRGRVTVHMADRVGARGRSTPTTSTPQALDYLKQRVVRLGLTNVETLLGAEDDARFPANALDMVFMAWVFHHVSQPVPLLRSVLPSLKPWGSVVMVEPTPAHTESTGRALTRELVSKEAKSAGFTLDVMVEGRLKEDNIFVLRPAVPDVARIQGPPEGPGPVGAVPCLAEDRERRRHPRPARLCGEPGAGRGPVAGGPAPVPGPPGAVDRATRGHRDDLRPPLRQAPDGRPLEGRVQDCAQRVSGGVGEGDPRRRPGPGRRSGHGP